MHIINNNGTIYDNIILSNHRKIRESIEHFFAPANRKRHSVSRSPKIRTEIQSLVVNL